MSYLPCELHCHTLHSDGSFSVAELLEKAREDHLALIALTDHNTVSGYEELNDGIVPAIKGIEWTTYYGHMLVLGAKTFVDWRDAVPDSIDEKIRQVRAAGGIAGIAHPFQIGSPVCTGGRWEFHVRDWRAVDYIEIWHGAFGPENHENARATELWTGLLDQGYHIAAVYGKDWHRDCAGHFGCTYLDISRRVNSENAIRAIRMGKTVVSSGAKFFFRIYKRGKTYELGDTVPKGTAVFCFYTDVHARQKNEGGDSIEYEKIKVITNAGRCVLETALTQRNVSLTLERGKWYRAELWGRMNGERAPLAITSPVYCR